jgi:hypothetical protein
MATQRRTAQITQEAIELFREGLELQKRGLDQRWEDDKPPGKRTRFIEIDKTLDRLLQRPWCPSLFDAALDRKRPPAYLRPDHQLYRDWFPSQALRRALIEALQYAQRAPS